MTKILELMYIISQSLSHENMSTWLALKLEVRKLEAEQTYLQNEVQKLKNIIQENSLLNLDVARLTTDIETIDAQMVCIYIFHILNILDADNKRIAGQIYKRHPAIYSNFKFYADARI